MWQTYARALSPIAPVFAMMLAACGSAASPSDGNKASGARLTRLVWDAGEGAVMLRGFHDTKLGVDCAFQPAADGRPRCLPTGRRVAYAGGEPSFADAGCSLPVVQWPACADAPVLVLDAIRTMPTCSDIGAQPVRAAGAKRETSTIYHRAGDVCVALPLDEGIVLYDVGDERPASEFVAADLTPQGTGRLAPYAFVTEDGTTEAVSIWDTALGGECSADGTTSALTCNPIEIAYAAPLSWGDAACSVPAAFQLPPRRPCAVANAVFDPMEPMSSSRLFTAGAVVPGDEAYHRDDNGQCVPVSSTDWVYYLVGDPIPAEALAPLAQATEGTGRVVAKRWIDGAGAALTEVTTLYDTVLDAPCYPVRFPDGFRCAADAAPADLYFRDAGCTEAVVHTDGNKPPFALASGAEVGLCGEVEATVAYSLGAVVDVPDPHVRDNSGSCNPHATPPETVFFALGPPIELPALEAR